MEEKIGGICHQCALKLPVLRIWYLQLSLNNQKTFIQGDDMVCSLDTQMTPEMHQRITALEQDLGKILLAFRCHDMKPSELSESELQKIREIEMELGLSLVAVEA